jgi:hypothetical protein
MAAVQNVARSRDRQRRRPRSVRERPGPPHPAVPAPAFGLIYDALATSSNSSTASWLCSATAACALLLSRSTSARACANSSGSPSHHSANAAIAASARSGSPWTSSAKYSANDATTRACRRPSRDCTASPRSKPVELFVAILHPPDAQLSEVSQIDEKKTAGQGRGRGETGGWAGDPGTDDLRLFLTLLCSGRASQGPPGARPPPAGWLGGVSACVLPADP